MSKPFSIKRSVAIDLLSSVALDRLATHRGQSRSQVLAELISEASRMTTKDMTRAEWDRYFGKARADAPSTIAT